MGRQPRLVARNAEPSADWVLAIFYGGPYGIDARARKVDLPVSVARRSSNSGAPVWNTAGDCHHAERRLSGVLPVYAEPDQGVYGVDM